jgi:hypothetical protein
LADGKLQALKYGWQNFAIGKSLQFSGNKSFPARSLQG